MAAAENKKLIARFFEELWNGRNLDIADELFAENYQTHQLRSGGASVPAPRDPAAVKEHVAQWLAAFPDLHFTLEQVIAEQDRVVTQCVMEGTHNGTWLGVPPTGKRVGIRMMVVHRIANGRIAEDWVLVESLGMFQQLGLLPSTQVIIDAFRIRAA